MSKYLRAPFPFFGHKGPAAGIVWRALGPEVTRYAEPFAGSLGVFLRRPEFFPEDPRFRAYLNDSNGFLVNFWRAIQKDPDAVKKYLPKPLHEVEFKATLQALIDAQGEDFLSSLEKDLAYHDARLAALWAWATCASIGRQIDITLQRGRVGNTKPRTDQVGLLNPKRDLDKWLDSLSAAVQAAYILSGDWGRLVSSPSAYGGGNGGIVGFFLDPPYFTGADVYGLETKSPAAAVFAWCEENGGDPKKRIVVAGHHGDWQPPSGWTAVSWRNGHPTYGKRQDDKEALWLSPHCHKDHLE